MIHLINEAWYAIQSNGIWFAGKYNAEFDEFYEALSGEPIAHREECTQIIELEG